MTTDSTEGKINVERTALRTIPLLLSSARNGIPMCYELPFITDKKFILWIPPYEKGVLVNTIDLQIDRNVRYVPNPPFYEYYCKGKYELLFEGTSRFYGDGELVYSETGDLLVLLTLQEVKKLGNLCDKKNRVVLPDWLLKKFIKENMYSFYHTLLMGEVEADGKSCREMDLMGIEIVYKRCHRKKKGEGINVSPG